MHNGPAEDRADGTIDPDKVVIDKAMTAKELLVMACRNNLELLAQAATVPEGAAFTLNLQFGLKFRREDVQAILAEAGFVVEPTHIETPKE